MTDDRITRLEEHLAHQSALLEELNEIVTSQRDEIDTLNRRMAMLMQRAAEQEADQMAAAPLSEQLPPHY